MANEYEKAREEFDPLFYVIGLLFFVGLYYLINRDGKKKPLEETEPPVPTDPKKTKFTLE
jgi:hypothetical protein